MQIKQKKLVDTIVALRKFKLDSGKKSSDKVDIAVKSSEFIVENKPVIEKLANIVIKLDVDAQGKTLVSTTGEWVIIEEEVDKEAQKALILKDIEKVKFEVERSNKMLSNPAFVAKAPEALVKTEKEKLAKNEELLKSLNEKLEALN